MEEKQRIDIGSGRVNRLDFIGSEEEYRTDIMIVTYNRLELTKRTLSSLFASSDCPYRLIVIDNASTDGTVEYLKELKERLEGEGREDIFIFNSENEGIARGRNRALSLSTAPWLVTLDNDVELPVRWLEEAINILKANRSYGAIGVNFEPNQYPLVEKNGFILQDKPKGNLGTACMVFNRSLHRLLGFFNYTDYSPFYGLEDSDFGMRVRVAGFKLGYLSRPGVHLGEGDADVGPYREFKTLQHDSNVDKFKKNCAEYWSKRKPLHVKYQP